MATGTNLIRLSRLLQPSKVSGYLSFLDGITEDLFGEIYCKNIEVRTSLLGDAAAYNLDLVFLKPVSVSLLNTGMALVLNPSREETAPTSEFNVSLEWRLPILRYVAAFDPDDFSFSTEDIIDLVLQVFQTTPEKLLAVLAEQLAGSGQMPEEGPYLPSQDFVDALNTALGLAGTANGVTYSDSPATSFEGIATALERANVSQATVLLKFVVGALTDPTEILTALVEFMKAVVEAAFPMDFEELLTPYFSTSLNDLRLGLTFPRAWLVPLDENDEPYEDENRLSTLIFNIGTLILSSTEGLVFEGAGDFDFEKSEIAGTGLTLEFNDLLLDLSDTENIPMAEAEGRAVTFKGVSIASAEIGLPKKWEKDSATGNAKIMGENLLIGSEGGFSGQLSLDTSQSSLLQLTLPGDVVLALDKFSIAFFQNSVTTVNIKGHVTLPALKDPNTGEDGKVAIQIGYADGVYSLVADASGAGILLKVSGLELTFKHFAISFTKSGIVGVDLSGSLKLPGLKDSTGQVAKIDFEMEIDEHGWKISASESEGVFLSIPNVVDIVIYSLEVGRRDKKLYVAVKADFDLKLDMPVIGDLLPDKVLVEYFKIWQDGQTEDVEVSVEWETSSGVEITVGNGEFSTVIPVNKTLFDIVTVSKIELSLDYSTASKIDLQALVSGSLALGPAVGVVEGIGIGLEIGYSESGGNIGPLDITPRFVPPKGIGVSLDVGVVKGGGYIEFDPDDGRYVGALELTIQDLVSLKAMGILSTKMPDGSSGLSFLIVITAEFTPIQLGFGFTLNGVGGLVGINRTMLLDVMREGVQTGALESLLFPKDPVANITKIIHDMEAIFPIHEGSHVFGPMGKIGWGTPTLLTLELGLLLEVPDPIRLAILGTLRMVLPDTKKVVAEINVAFLGAIDFDAKYLSFDASLFKSRILTFTLEGDMALRLTWGDKPNFLLSIGGFHPDFTPPPLDLPDMKRLSINLFTGNNPRLTLSAYFALTSNTVQVGARAELYVYVDKILGSVLSVQGFLGFDALFQFSPFWFIIEIEAGLSVMYGGDCLLSIYLYGSLEGPSPWKVKGTAEFKVLGFKFAVDVKKTFGEKDAETLPDKEVLPLLKEALADDRNWSAKLPNAKGNSVTLKTVTVAEGIVLADPISSLGVTQKIVPTEVEIAKFGQYKPKDSVKKWTLKLHDSAGTALDSELLYELFAPAQFFEKSDTDKIGGKSFEQMKAGVMGKKGKSLTATAFVERPVKYEETVYDDNAKTASPTKKTLTKARFATGLRGSAIARSQMGVKTARVSVFAPGKVTVAAPQYKVVSKSDQSLYGTTTTTSAIEAGVEMKAAVAASPILSNSLQVVTAIEL